MKNWEVTTGGQYVSCHREETWLESQSTNGSYRQNPRFPALVMTMVVVRIMIVEMERLMQVMMEEMMVMMELVMTVMVIMS